MDLTWLSSRLAPRVEQDSALPGRDYPMFTKYPEHATLGLPLNAVPAEAEIAYFSMGCYWGAEKLFWELPGVLNTAVGFMGGYTPHPSYQECCTGRTGHTETVQVVFDPVVVSFVELMRVFFENHDPTQGDRQGNDIGSQYRSAVFTVGPDQAATAAELALQFQSALSEAGMGEITTDIEPAAEFYYAEEEHQQYLHKNPAGYQCDHRTGVSCSPD